MPKKRAANIESTRNKDKFQETAAFDTRTPSVNRIRQKAA